MRTTRFDVVLVRLFFRAPCCTPEMIERAVENAIAVAAPGGGFILGTSDSIRDGTPIENVRAYFAAARKYGSLWLEGKVRIE